MVQSYKTNILPQGGGGGSFASLTGQPTDNAALAATLATINPEPAGGGTFVPSAIAITHEITTYNQYDQTTAVSVALDLANSTYNFGAAVVYWNSNGAALSWNTNLVDAGSGLNSTLATNFPSFPAGTIRQLIVVFDEANARGLVYLPQGTVGGTAGATDLDMTGHEVANFKRRVVTGVSGLLSMVAHAGNVLMLTGNVTIPTTTGFNATLVFGGAFTATFNATVTAAQTNGDVIEARVDSPTSCRLTKAPNIALSAPTTAITLDARTMLIGTPAVTPQTVNHTIGAGSNQILVIKTTIDHGTADVADIKWGGSGGTSLGIAAVSRVIGGFKQYFHILKIPAQGTLQVWVSLTTAANIGVEVVSLNNVFQATPIAASGGLTFDTTAISTAQAGPLAPNGTGNWLETAVMLNVSTVTSTPGGGQTETSDVAIGSNHRYIGGFAASVNAAITPSWAFSTATIGLLNAVLFRAA